MAYLFEIVMKTVVRRVDSNGVDSFRYLRRKNLRSLGIEKQPSAGLARDTP